MTDHHTAAVARDLTEILDLHQRLIEEALANGAHPLMPGGPAMVELGHVANIEAWESLNETTERTGRAYTSEIDEDPDNAWTAYQTLEFWSEGWRREQGAEYHDQRTSIETEARFLRSSLDWAWDNELHFDEFAADMRAARRKLEDVLNEGMRAAKGVPCLSCATTLIRPVANPRTDDHCEGDERGVCAWPDHRHCTAHDRGGLRDWWLCPNDDCGRWYPAEDYQRAVADLAFANADWLTIERAGDRTRVKRGTIKAWATRDKVRRRRDVESGRVVYHVGDIETARDGADDERMTS